MDEEQGLASPISGSLRGIRRSVSSNVFTGRSVLPPQPDPVTTNLISQNSLALGTVSGQLTNISEQVKNLNGSLSALQENLSLSDSLDRQREAAKQRREAILAEQGLREGKESELENKMQTALLSPVRRIAQKTQGILSRLANFFFILLGGWLVNTTLDFLSLLSNKNIEKFNEFKRKLAADLLTIGGILLIGTIGIKKLITISAGLAVNAFRITFGSILKAPFDAVIKFLFNLVRKSKNAFLKSVGLLGKKGGTSIATKVGGGLLALIPGGIALQNFIKNRGKVSGDITTSGGAKITGDIVEEGVEQGAKKGFFQRLNPFAKKVGGEVVEKGAKVGLMGFAKGMFRRLFGPFLNFFLDISFGETLERALAGAAGFAAGAKITATLASPLLLSPEPFTKILYGALVLGGGLMGEQAAKSMITGVMNMFGMGGKKEESNVEAGAASSITNAEAKAQIEKENQGIEVTGMTFGGSELISAAKNNREMVGENISSLEEPAPNLITLPIGGAQPAGSAEQGSAESSSSPTTSIPTIHSSDSSNPYLSFAESIYGVLD